MLYDIEKYKKRENFNEGFWDEFMSQDVLEDFPRRGRRLPGPAINVMENENEFILELASPGFCKEDYVLQVEDNTLTITGKGNESEEEVARNYNRREFSTSSFERSFLLPDYVKSDEIAASCADGILTIHIPKHETRVQQKRSIDIS